MFVTKFHKKKMLMLFISINLLSVLDLFLYLFNFLCFCCYTVVLSCLY